MTRPLAVCFIALLLAACVDSEARETRHLATGAAPGDGVVILADETGFPACVADAIRSAESALKVIPEQEFREALFPWYRDGFDENSVATLHEKPLVPRRLTEIRARYLVAVSGDTKTNITGDGVGSSGGGGAAGAYAGKNGIMLCGAGAGGAGCLGFMAWERTTDLSATVWDLGSGTRAGTVDANISGASIMPAFVLPVPFIAPTETTACHALGTRLIRFLSGNPPPETVPEEAETP